MGNSLARMNRLNLGSGKRYGNPYDVPQKARIFLALLGKQYGLDAEGWREAAGPYGEQGSYRSVADIVDKASLAKVREHKKAAKLAAR